MMRRLLILWAVIVAVTVSQGASAQTINLMPTRVDIHDETSRRVAVTLVRGIRRSRDLPSARLVRARLRMSRGQAINVNLLRELADLGDGSAAFKMAKTLEERDSIALMDDVAHYYGIAAATGRAGAIYGLVHASTKLDPAQTSETRLTTLRNILIAYARAGNSVAAEALVRFHVNATPFGTMDAELDAILDANDTPGANIIALQLATELVQLGWNDSDKLSLASAYLDRASDTDSLRIQLIAGNLRPVLAARQASLPLAPTHLEEITQ